mmetsp:Transcript_33900/g.88248  ORF Transcript_33900/g.88248 Transcript_33900/m.88248 type:complete len:525 (-) Transcript_33900:270-1844(-)
MRILRSRHRVHSHITVPVGRVLEPHRHGQPARQFTMELALRCSSPDGSPRHQISDVLRCQGVQKLTPTRYTRIVDLLQQLPGRPEAFVHLVGPVQIRIIDQTLPANRRPRLLKVHTHDYHQLPLVCLHLRLQSLSILQGGSRVMDGARPDHNHHAIVLSPDHLCRRRPRGNHGVHRLLRRRELLDNKLRVGHCSDFPDAQVVHPVIHVGGLVELDGSVGRQPGPLGSGLAGAATGLYSSGQRLQALHSCGPADTCVGHRHTVPEGLLCSRGFLQLLCPLHEVGLQHHTSDSFLTFRHLPAHLSQDLGLILVVLVRIAVAAIDDETRADILLPDLLQDRLHTILGVVRSVLPSSKHHVTVGVALAVHDRHGPLLGGGEECMRILRSRHRVHSHITVPVGRVLEPHRHGQPARQFTMELALRCSSPDGSPRHQISDVLRCQGVQKLTPTRYTRIVDLLQQLPGRPEAFVHLVGPVQIRIIDQTLPANRRPRLLKVHTHDHKQVFAVSSSLTLQPRSILQGGCRVVY